MDLYWFDFHGAYLGYLRESDLFDCQGRRWAQLVEGCRLRDPDGRARGYIDAQGSLFDERGSCRGYLRGWTDAADTSCGSGYSTPERRPGSTFMPQPSFWHA